VKRTFGGLVVAALVAATTLRAQPPPPPAEPYKKAGEQTLDFRGPGRDAPEPDVSEVVLGWFGPGDPDHPEFGDFWRGATLALRQENADGGYRGKPFRLEAAWSESPWKAGILDVTRLVYDRGAWAVIGGVDGTTTHLAVQLALKSYFLLLSPGSTDVTADLANVPWLFSLPPSDERLAPVLARAIGAAAGTGCFTVVSGTDHDSHAALVSLRRALAARRLTPAALVELAGDRPELPAVAARLLKPWPRAVAVLAGSRVSAGMVKALRAAGHRGAIVVGASAAREAFSRAAGPAADDVLAPRWLDTSAPAWRAFADGYRKRWGTVPDWSAAQGYDAVRLVAAAIRAVGLNRPRIRDAVRALAPYVGASGLVRWNALGRNEPGVSMGVWRNGLLNGTATARQTDPEPMEREALPPR
jgi:branched-chain amino acid transport system substrate-binding protein